MIGSIVLYLVFIFIELGKKPLQYVVELLKIKQKKSSNTFGVIVRYHITVKNISSMKDTIKQRVTLSVILFSCKHFQVIKYNNLYLHYIISVSECLVC